MAIGFDSVSATLPVAFPGMRSSSHFGHVDGMINGEASAEIPFGVCVAQGSVDKSAIKLAATSDKLVGIVMFRHGYADTIELGTTGRLQQGRHVGRPQIARLAEAAQLDET